MTAALLYQLCWYFLLYSFLGWCVEVIYCAVHAGRVVNRGFLNGPVCPIYGVGMVTVLLMLRAVGIDDPARASLPLLFFGGMALASGVELAGGWLLQKLFGARWWDYSQRPFNIGGYICLEFSLIWGLGAAGVVRMVHPLLARLVARVPAGIGWPVLGVMYALFAADMVVTVLMVAGLNRDIRQLDQVRQAMRLVSNGLSDTLGTGAMATDQKLDEGRLQMWLAAAEARDAMSEAADNARERAADMRAAMGEAADSARDAMNEAARRARVRQAMALLEQRQKALRADILGKRHFGGGRLLRAFPHMAHTRYREILEDLKDRMGRE